MRRKLLVYIMIGLLSFVLIAASTTYAWFVRSNNYKSDLIGSSKVSYFADGTGTSLDPFIISNANHMFNLSKLQEMGYLQDKTYHFLVADEDTLAPITIDFTGAGVALPYQLFNPIGDHIYPFIGVFEGNQSTLKNIKIDGSTKQDIGVFGYIGDDATVRNFFIEDPIIYSNPTSATPIDDFHEHNDGHINRATGYIVGHLSASALLEKIYVISPKIDSSGNAMPNRSQYGLIGYTASSGGIIDGGPRDKYFFSLNADWAYDVFTAARSNYLNHYINNGSLRLSAAIPSSTQLIGNTQTTSVPINYSISTLKISPTANDPSAPYLYDQMVLDGLDVDQQGSVYSRQNIDIVGGVNITGTPGSRAFAFSRTFNQFPTPNNLVNQPFVPTQFPGSIILYVRPTTDPANLGTITANYAGGGGLLAYVPGIQNNNYINSIKLNGMVSFPSGQSIMNASNAFVKVYSNANNDGYTVAPANSTDFDYYVFLIANTNSNSTSIRSVLFEYSPAVLSESDLESIKDVDFINTQNDVLNASPYVNSYMNFGYDMIGNHTLVMEVNRRPIANDGYDVYIDFIISDTSVFYVDFININSKNITIYVNNQEVYIGSNTIITLRMNANETVTVIVYS